jgi:hypothetical protein
MATARRRSTPQALQRWDIALSGVTNGINVSFATPEFFLQVSNLHIRVYLNGQRLREGAGNDYTVAESGGLGTGFDTVILAIAPRSGDTVTADFIATT